jgi:Leucine-rich repeat (LRR) protein
MDRKSVLLMMMLAAFFIMAASSHMEDDGFTSVPSHHFVSNGRYLLEERHRFSSSMDRHEKRDVQALLSFKDHIKEDPAGKLSNWTAENSKAVCSWYGITCRQNTRRIVAIILPAALVRFVGDFPEYRLQLQGTLSPSLGNLSLLHNLNLSGNNLTGRIPPELGQLKALRISDLFGNWLEISIPKSISNCTRLRWIDLSYNFLTGTIPTEFGRLVELEHLNFSGNYLGGSIPASLSNCTSLREFSIRNIYVGGNNFSGPIPSAFGLTWEGTDSVVQSPLFSV